MPINVEIKKKDPRFNWDRPRWNIVASGPVELLQARIERFMFLHGMNGLPASDDFATSSSRASIGAPPVYLAALVKGKYGCRLKPTAARMVDQAVKARGPRGSGRRIGMDERAKRPGRVGGTDA